MNNKLFNTFEADLFQLIKNIVFRRFYDSFQKKLNKDIKEVKGSKNMYKINPSKYLEILRNKITDN